MQKHAYQLLISELFGLPLQRSTTVLAQLESWVRDVGEPTLACVEVCAFVFARMLMFVRAFAFACVCPDGFMSMPAGPCLGGQHMRLMRQWGKCAL